MSTIEAGRDLTDALDRRDGLPAAFRFLETGCPRSAWPTMALHPLAQHWLDIHGWFRGQIAELEAIGGAWREGRIDAAAYRAAAPPRLGQLLNNLHHHHTLETEQAFPMLMGAEPRMADGFALLDRDHDAIEHLLSAMAEAANALVQAGFDPGASASALPPLAENLSDRIERGAALINNHLRDEEEIVVPVLTLRGAHLRF